MILVNCQMLFKIINILMQLAQIMYKLSKTTRSYYFTKLKNNVRATIK